jgi:ribonuclease P protein component
MRAEPRDASGSRPEVAIGSRAEAYPRCSRLIAAQDFAAALKSRWRTSATWFSAHIVRSAGDTARLGLAITKRVAPRAVDRNRIKRLVRESFRRHKSALGSVDVVIRLRRLPGPAEWDEAKAEIRLLIDRIADRSKDQ